MASSSERTAACMDSPALPSQESSASTFCRNSGSSRQASSSSPARHSGSHSAARWNNSSICAQRSGVMEHLSALHFVVKPRFRHPQVAPDCDSGHIQRLRDLIHGETAEVSEFDGLALPGIELFERFEATVEGYEITAPLVLKAHRLFQ